MDETREIFTSEPPVASLEEQVNSGNGHYLHPSKKPAAESSLAPKKAKDLDQEIIDKLENVRIGFEKDPQLLKEKIEATVATFIWSLENKPDEKIHGLVAFKLPEDSHLLPLFENELFTQLVKYHNEKDTEQTSIHPHLLMNIDPMYPSILKDHKTTSRGETVLEHELQHFFEYQDRTENTSNAWAVFKLYKAGLENNKTISYSAQIVDEEQLRFKDQVEVALAPRLPSSEDISKVLGLPQEDLPEGILRWPIELLKDGYALKRLKEKAHQQGQNDILPFSAQQLQDTLFEVWKEARKDTINFPEWYMPYTLASDLSEEIAANSEKSKETSLDVYYQQGKISRREFLKLLGIGALTFGGVGSFLKIVQELSQMSPEIDGQEAEKLIQQAKETIKNEYSLDVYNGQPENDPGITGSELSRYELARGLGLVMEEIIKYPQDFFKKNGVTAIRFLNNVKVNGLDYYGGYADLEGTIGLAYHADPADTNGNREYARGVFHHELFHILDYKDGGYDRDNYEWEIMHNCSCQPYREIGGRDPLEDPPPSPANWFVDLYGRRNSVEDRAVFGQTVMISDAHKHLIKLIHSESDDTARNILTKKYTTTLGYYKKWSGGSMDNQYWEDLKDSKLKSDYFSSEK